MYLSGHGTSRATSVPSRMSATEPAANRWYGHKYFRALEKYFTSFPPAASRGLSPHQEKLNQPRPATCHRLPGSSVGRWASRERQRPECAWLRSLTLPARRPVPPNGGRPPRGRPPCSSL